MPQNDINRARFLKIAYESDVAEHARAGIGTYKEKKLHLILKKYFDGDPSHEEVPFEGFVTDIYNGSEIMEIQTSGFASMGDKLEAFLPLCPVTVVYPIAMKKWVCWIDPETGEFSPKHRSPKKGRILDAVPEMVRILRFLHHPHLRIRVVLLVIDEYRLQDGKRGRDGKRGSHRFERMPVDLYEIFDLCSAEDYALQLPPLPDPFTSAEFASACRLRGRHVSAALKVFEEMGVIARTGKRGNAILYRVSFPTE